MTAKRFVYNGFKAALEAGVPRGQGRHPGGRAASGQPFLVTRLTQGYVTACPAEKTGQEEFDFEYGEDFAKHIETFNPTFCKVEVRYNPEGNQELNRRQSERLKRLSDYLHGKGQTRFLLELLMPPEKAQLQELKGDKEAYDSGGSPCG